MQFTTIDVVIYLKLLQQTITTDSSLYLGRRSTLHQCEARCTTAGFAAEDRGNRE